jgi:hypothetical protein
LIAIKGVGFEVPMGGSNIVCYNEDPFRKVTYVVNVTYPGGSYTATNQRRWSMWRDLPVGDVSFAFEIRMEPCQQPGNGRIRGWFTGWVAYEGFWRAATATATLAIPGNFKDQITSAIVNGTETVSGDAVAHLAGTVQGGQVIKVKAPIVLLNYIYGIAGSPPAPPSRGGGEGEGGGGEVGRVRLKCEVDQSASIIGPPPSNTPSSGTGSSGSGASPSTPNPQPAKTISGSSGPPDYYFLNQQVEVLRRGVCLPI